MCVSPSWISAMKCARLGGRIQGVVRVIIMED